MADVIMQLTQFQRSRNNFSILNFSTVRLREHDRDIFLISNNCEMASFKEMQSFTYCLNYSNGFLLDSGIPLFTSRESSRHERNRTAILRQYSHQRKARRIRLDFEGHAVLNGT